MRRFEEKITSSIYCDIETGKNWVDNKLKKLLKFGLIYMLRADYVKIEDVHLNAF